MLLLGTGNRKKGIELAGLFRPVDAELRTLADFSDNFEVVEDGDSFAANATTIAVSPATVERLVGGPPHQLPSPMPCSDSGEVASVPRQNNSRNEGSISSDHARVQAEHIRPWCSAGA